MWSHVLGIVGETLNFSGAIVLAFDLLWRTDDEKNRASLRELKELAREYGAISATHEDAANTPISSPEFEGIVLGARAVRLAAWGLSLMALGFLCLIGYHTLEICG